MNTILYHNIYVSVNEMPEVHSKFYTEYYNYKMFCIKEYNKIKNESFKFKSDFKEVVAKLNDAYSKIKDLKDVPINSVSEYIYPSVGYRKKDNNIFACINGTNMRLQLDFSKILFYIALYNNSNIIARKNATGNHIIMESSIENILLNMKDNEVIYQSKKMLPILKEVLKPFQNYPKSSLTELDLGDAFSKKDIETFLKDF